MQHPPAVLRIPPRGAGYVLIAARVRRPYSEIAGQIPVQPGTHATPNSVIAVPPTTLRRAMTRQLRPTAGTSSDPPAIRPSLSQIRRQMPSRRLRRPSHAVDSRTRSISAGAVSRLAHQRLTTTSPWRRPRPPDRTGHNSSTISADPQPAGPNARDPRRATTSRFSSTAGPRPTSGRAIAHAPARPALTSPLMPDVNPATRSG